MKTDIPKLNNRVNTNFYLEKTSAKMNLSDVFANRSNSYLNEYTLFVAHFNSVPSFIHEVEIDCKRANTWFLEFYSSEVKEYYYNRRYYNRSKRAELDNIFYFIVPDPY